MADLKNVLQRLDNVAKSLETNNGGAGKNQARPKPNFDRNNLAVKGGFAGNKEKDSKGYTPLAKSLETVGKIRKDLRYLASDRVLENPSAFFRKKDASGKYEVRGQVLETIARTLMSNVESREEYGVPFEQWLGGNRQIFDGLEGAAQKGMFGSDSRMVQRALTSSNAPALIRTDLEPVIYEVYLRKFPIYDMVSKIPANGLVHTYDRRTATGTAAFISELGDMSSSFDNSTFERKQNSNIAVGVAPRGISLKLQYAVAQSGMPFDANNLEITGALTDLARLFQSAMLQGNFTVASKTLDDEEGLTNANAFDGLRYLLKNYAIDKGNTEDLNVAINRAVKAVANAGADMDELLIIGSYGAKTLLNTEFQNFYRVVSQAQNEALNTNLMANGMVTVADVLARFQAVPANAQKDGVGYYTKSSVVTEDAFVLDPNEMAFAYLGSPTPTVLELPIGYNNALSSVFFPFMMAGLVLYRPEFCRKVRMPQQA